LIKQVFPALVAGAADAQALVDHMVRFALGGLAEVSKRAKHRSRLSRVEVIGFVEITEIAKV